MKQGIPQSDFIVTYHFSGKGYLDVNCTFIPGNDTLPLLPRMGVLNLGMSIMGIDQNLQKVVKGLVLLAAVIFDVVSKRKSFIVK